MVAHVFFWRTYIKEETRPLLMDKPWRSEKQSIVFRGTKGRTVNRKVRTTVTKKTNINSTGCRSSEFMSNNHVNAAFP